VPDFCFCVNYGKLKSTIQILFFVTSDLAGVKNIMPFSINNFIAIAISDQAVECLSWFSEERIVASRVLLEPGVVINNTVTQANVLAEKIKIAVKDLRLPEFIGSRHVAISLTSSQTYVYSFALETVASRAKLEAVILNKLHQILPLPLKELYWDYIITKQTDRSMVIFAATPRRIIDDYRQTLALANLKLVLADIEELSLLRSLLPGTGEDHSLILDFNRRSINLVFADNNGWLRLSAALPFNEQRLPGTLSEIKQTLNYYEKKYSCQVFDCYLSGSGSLLNGLADMVSGILSKKVQLGHPVNKFNTVVFDDRHVLPHAVNIGLIMLTKSCQSPYLNLVVDNTDFFSFLTKWKSFVNLAGRYWWVTVLVISIVTSYFFWLVFTMFY